MQLSADHIQSIRYTWRYFKNIDPGIFGDAFYTKLFTDNPLLKVEFNGDISVYYQNLFDFLNMAVARIDRRESLNSAIEDMANRQFTNQLLEIHQSALEKALVWTLQKGIGPEWSVDIEYAWKLYFHLLIGKIRKCATLAE
jgi:nitric oxide dioxygenase